MRVLLLPLLLAACQSDDGKHPIPKGERPTLDDTAPADTDTDADADTDTDTDADTDTDTDSDSDTDADPSEACHPDIAGWPAAWADWEEQVLTLVNEERTTAHDCGTYGSYPAAGPLRMDPYLRCAARYHSLWMAETGNFEHESPGGDLGDDPWQRMTNAGFTGTEIGENIAAGYDSPEAVVAGWMDSDGHCSNIMNGDATLIGVGYYRGGGYYHYWTQDFGS